VLTTAAWGPTPRTKALLIPLMGAVCWHRLEPTARGAHPKPGNVQCPPGSEGNDGESRVMNFIAKSTLPSQPSSWQSQSSRANSGLGRCRGAQARDRAQAQAGDHLSFLVITDSPNLALPPG
jgi:hypothetical protein